MQRCHFSVRSQISFPGRNFHIPEIAPINLRIFEIRDIKGKKDTKTWRTISNIIRGAETVFETALHERSMWFRVLQQGSSALCRLESKRSGVMSEKTSVPDEMQTAAPGAL